MDTRSWCDSSNDNETSFKTPVFHIQEDETRRKSSNKVHRVKLFY